MFNEHFEYRKSIVCTLPLALSVGGRGGGVEHPTKFSKRGDKLDRSPFRRGLLGKRGMNFFSGSAIFT